MNINVKYNYFINSRDIKSKFLGNTNLSKLIICLQLINNNSNSNNYSIILGSIIIIIMIQNFQMNKIVIKIITLLEF